VLSLRLDYIPPDRGRSRSRTRKQDPARPAAPLSSSIGRPANSLDSSDQRGYKPGTFPAGKMRRCCG
jgi:hypothetical protein